MRKSLWKKPISCFLAVLLTLFSAVNITTWEPAWAEGEVLEETSGTEEALSEPEVPPGESLSPDEPSETPEEAVPSDEPSETTDLIEADQPAPTNELEELEQLVEEENGLEELSENSASSESDLTETENSPVSEAADKKEQLESIENYNFENKPAEGGFMAGLGEAELNNFIEENNNGYTGTSNLNFVEVLDYSADEQQAKSAVRSGLTAGVKSLASMDPRKIIEWGVGSLFDAIFGSEEDEVQKSLEQINEKLDEINDRLDQVLEELKNLKQGQEQIQYSQKVQSIEADLQAARNAGMQVKAFIDLARQSAVFDANASQLEKEDAYEMLFDMYPNIYDKINTLAHYLYEPNVYSKKSIYYNLRWLCEQNRFYWDSQMIDMQLLTNGVYTEPYLYACAIYLGMLSYRLDTLDPSSRAYRQHLTLFKATIKNSQEVADALEQYTIKPKVEGAVSFLCSDGENYIPIVAATKATAKTTITYDFLDNKNDSEEWEEWLLAKEKMEDGSLRYCLSPQYYQIIRAGLQQAYTEGEISDEYIKDYFLKLVDISGTDFLYEGIAIFGHQFAIRAYDPYDLDPDYESFDDLTFMVYCYGSTTQDFINGRSTGNSDIMKIQNESSPMNGSSSKSIVMDTSQVGILMTSEASFGYDSKYMVQPDGSLSRASETGSIFLTQYHLPAIIIGTCLLLLVGIGVPLLIRKKNREEL